MADETVKDLTGIFDLGQTPPSPEENEKQSTADQALEEATRVEPIDSFPEPGDFTGDFAADVSDKSQTELQPPSDPEPSIDLVPNEDPFAMPSEDLNAVQSPAATLQTLKNFSEGEGLNQPTATQATPFRLTIHGTWSDLDKSRLKTFLTDESIGIQWSDLKDQIEAGQVLIPQITEYVGVLLVRLLRDSNLEFNLLPTAREASPMKNKMETVRSTLPRSIDSIPIYSQNPPLQPNWSVIDLVAGSYFLEANVVEIENSAEYQTALDALKKSLRTQAFRKSGIALTDFQVKLDRLALPSQYRLTATAQVIGLENPRQPDL